MASRGKGKKRSSTRRAAKPTKDETVETRSAGAKQYKLPEGSRIEHHLANVEAWEKKFSDLKAHVKKAYQAAGAEGITKQLLTELRALKEGDAIAHRQRLEALGIGLKVIGAPFQLNVFDTMYENDVEQAKAEAKAAARAGKSPECRFAEGSPAAEAYLETYALEQARMAPGVGNMSEDELRAAVASGKTKAQEPVHAVN